MLVNPRNEALSLAKQALGNSFGEYKPTALYTYTDENDLPLYYRFRMDHKTDAKKCVRPFFYDGNQWLLKEPDLIKKPLYSLQRLKRFPNDVVYFVEGEKCVDALIANNLLAVTNGGATNWNNLDVSPLKNRSVVLWRDNDDAGIKWQTDAEKNLEGIAESLQVIDVEALHLPEKGDCVDWLAVNPNATINDIAALPIQQSLLSGDNAKHDSLKLHVKTICATDIEPEAISWLWPQWIARKKLTLLAGMAGTGKTTAALSLAATLTNEGYWPDSLPCRDADNVLIWSGEDDPADTLVPRLIAAGANLNRVHFIAGMNEGAEEKAFDPAVGIPLLEAKAKEIGGAGLLIIDPIVSAVAGDMHKANDVRRDLQSVVDFAAKNNCAVLGITHFAKGGQGSSPQERVIGSQAFGALARMILVAAQQESGEGCVLARAKSNIAKHDGGIAYTIKPVTIKHGIETTTVQWGDAVEGNARAILSDMESGSSKTQTDEAMELLPTVLIGEMLSRDVIAAMKSDGFSDKVTRTAFKRLNGHHRRDGFGKDMKSFWELKSPFIPTPAIHSHLPEQGKNEETGKEWTGETIL